MSGEPKRSWVQEARDAEEKAKAAGGEGEGIDLVAKMQVLEDLDETGVEISEVPEAVKRLSSEVRTSLPKRAKSSAELNSASRKTTDTSAVGSIFDDEE